MPPSEQRTAARDKLFRCDCGYATGAPSWLKRHMKTHVSKAAPKDYHCDNREFGCKMSSSRKFDVSKHIRLGRCKYATTTTPLAKKAPKIHVCENWKLGCEMSSDERSNVTKHIKYNRYKFATGAPLQTRNDLKEQSHLRECEDDSEKILLVSEGTGSSLIEQSVIQDESCFQVEACIHS